MKRVVVIGNGVAGITAARFIRKLSDAEITVVSSETDHHYARTALMYIYMGHLTYEDTKPYEDWFWERNRINLVRGTAIRLDVPSRSVLLESGTTLDYDVLLLATGSKSEELRCGGHDLDAVQGLYGLPDLASMDKWTAGIEHAAVVGGGLIGVEMAEMLHSRRISVTFLVREAAYMDYLLPSEESEMVAREITANGIDLRLSTRVASVLGDGQGRAHCVTTSAGESIPCQFVGLTVGVRPNIGFLRGSGIETSRGVLVNRYFETNMPGVYAIGDCAEFREPGIGHTPVEQLWYTARRHGRTVARTVCGDRTAYDRGVFYNSAKFFNLEYQTYGEVAPNHQDGVESVFWRSKTERKLVRVNFGASSGQVTGFSLLGVRFRHRVCEEWLRSGASVNDVVRDLREATFDPEFSKDVVEAFQATFSRRHKCAAEREPGR
jgi:NAD(P)H-nitrite reductase large subunit